MVSATAEGAGREMRSRMKDGPRGKGWALGLDLLSLTRGLLSLLSLPWFRLENKKVSAGQIGEAFVTCVTLFSGRTSLLLEDGGNPVAGFSYSRANSIPSIFGKVYRQNKVTKVTKGPP